MANKTITMLKIKRIIQLKAAGKSKSHIARELGIHRATLNTYLTKLAASGKSFESLLKLDDDALGRLVLHDNNTVQPDARLQVLQEQFPSYVEELNKTGVTRQLLWQEYIERHPDGYGYTQFCEHFRRYTAARKATMHFMHEPARYLQVDFAGRQLSYRDPLTGELVSCPVLVCTMPYSGYTYVEALSSMRQQELFSAMNRCLEFLGGVPRNILSDNMKQYVTKNDRYEFSFSDLVDQWALHYKTNLEATRPQKPKDKPSVENSVYHSYLRIFALLRKQEFRSRAELNVRIMELLERHNAMAFQKKPLSRKDRFMQEEYPLLEPLPAEPFEVKHRTLAKVQFNYHVYLGEDAHYYSVPSQYIGQQTRIVYTEQFVEIYLGHKRIAFHSRNHNRYSYSTLEEHMPPNHKAWHQQSGWNADHFMTFATRIGEASADVFSEVLASKCFVEQTYRACIGLKNLATNYGHQRFENACRRALQGGRVSYGRIKTILHNNIDKQDVNQQNLFSLPEHHNIRGRSCYQ